MSPIARRRAGLGLALAVLIAGQGHAAAGCGADAICGVKNPEDVVRIGDSAWAIASRLARGGSGGFYAIDLRRRRATALVPDVTGRPRAAYGDCPGPPAAGSLITHGLDVRLTGPRRRTVFAVNHGGRQSIEVFDLRLGPAGPALTWAGCVMIPADVSANAVAALPDGVAVSSFGSAEDATGADLAAGRPSGFVDLWSDARGWRRLPGSDIAGDNGLAASPDGAKLYVNGWGDGTLHILSLHPAGAAPIIVALGDVHPDNLHLIAHGRLLIAGQVGARATILHCGAAPVCPVGSRVMLFDPATGRLRNLATRPPTHRFGAASAAVLFHHQLWAGSFQGDRLQRLAP